MITLKQLQEAFGEDEGLAAYAVLGMSHNDLEEHPAGRERIEECYHHPEWWDVRMHVLNDVLHMHGVESIEVRDDGISCYADYLNTGETYATTILHWEDEYRLESVGDFVEWVEREGLEVV